MPDKTKRIFISDIHLSDDRSMNAPHPFGWFKKNIPLLAQFLDDAGLNPKSKIKLGVPGYPDALSVEDIGNKYKDLCLNWEKSPGNINVPTAIFNDLGNLSFAASLAYFMQIGSKIDIVIFGHTHIPAMNNPLKNTPISGGDISIPGKISSSFIYANSGIWLYLCGN